MTKEKQEWIYTKDGVKLQKKSLTTKLDVNKWYFITPWVVWLVTIVYSFSLGGNWAAFGFLLIVFGPVPITYLNIKTLKILVQNKTAKAK